MFIAGTNLVQNGWPDRVSEESLKPYWCRRSELSVQFGCIMSRDCATARLSHSTARTT